MFQPEHAPTGTVCMKCGMHASKHRKERGKRTYNDERSRKHVDRIIGLDGEGIGRNPHRYVYLAAVDEDGKTWDIARQDRLSSELVLDFLCSLPIRCLIVGFSLGYDLTKWLQDLPDKAIYLLLHEELRQRMAPNGMVVYKPITWNGYSLNYMNKRFTVRRLGSKRSTTVWDIFRFFQSSFVKALEAWKVCPQSEIDEINRMKEQRSVLESLPREEVYAYCQKECLNLTRLTRALIEAHKAAGLELKSYYGAGSTASVFLAREGIADKRGEIPEAMRVPLACSFFGGRFENSTVGAIQGMVYGYDISSAYPYQTTLLPCLQCGHWEHVKRSRKHGCRLSGRLSLVRWRSSKQSSAQTWGGLPIRTSDGTIIFPLAGKGGWCWQQEFETARQLNPTLEPLEVWSYETDCNHRPFASVPQYYRERVALGKDAKGIVLKLGINSIYGKLAQSKGTNPPFQSWVWAGNITSNTRAQLLTAILRADNPADILMLATDGVYSRSKLKLDLPVDTGTWDLAKPLGGWEEKEIPGGIFAVRPGIYFPLNPTVDQIQEVRGRGLGRKALFDSWQTIVEAWEQGKSQVTIGNMTRFIGAKSGLSKSNQGVTRRACFGEWEPHSINVSFAPQPKRQAINSDGSLQPWGYLDFESVPYDPATLSNEAIMLKLAEMIAEEQPDGDFDFQ